MRSSYLLLMAGLFAAAWSGPVAAVQSEPARLVFSCDGQNDLYRVLARCGMRCPRYDDPGQAIEAAGSGAGVLLLADEYPQKPQSIDPSLFDLAAQKGLRLYVEFPASLPGIELGSPRDTKWERGVITSKAFGPRLEPMRIVAIHDCHFLPAVAGGREGERSMFSANVAGTEIRELAEKWTSPRPPGERLHLVIAKVAGLDTALYGLPEKDVWPILFESPEGKTLVSTTKLSQFVTARYAPTEAWAAVWEMILRWLQPGLQLPDLQWIPVVRPSYSRDEPLPADAERQAIRRGNDWVLKARMLIHPSWYSADWGTGPKLDAMSEKLSAVEKTSLRFDLPPGDGTAGMLEGLASRIRYDGSQDVRWSLRTDCTGEHVAPFVLAGKLLGEPRYTDIGKNLADFVLFKFDATAPWNTPSNPAYGLIGWACSPTMIEPIDQTGSLYGVISARVCMSTLAAATVLGLDRWDDRVLEVMLANFRTSGRFGFRETALRRTALEKNGWQFYYQRPTLNLASHPTAQLLAANLMAYQASGYRPLLDRTKRAIGLLMDAYPYKLKWWNGLQQERGRLLLPLAWLVRADDTPEHRAWLDRVADDFLESQVPCGAIREELGETGKGVYPAPPSNEAYGSAEASLIQSNGDPVCDLLYTINSGFLGLHEAAAATGDPKLREAENRLAAFLCRIQTRSDERPELDGTWFRAFEFDRWDYWASNADLGWGAWCVETGWVQGWIVTVLSLRQMETTLWDLTTRRPLDRHLGKNLEQLMPQAELNSLRPPHPHAALDRPITLAAEPTRGPGSPSLMDGFLQEDSEQQNLGWLAFHDSDLEATVDLGEPIEVHTLAAHFLQEKRLGIYLPRQVEFAVSTDGKLFRSVTTVAHDVPKSEAGPLMRTLAAENLDVTARYIRVRASKTGTAGRDWLFVDEILVNPSTKEPQP